MPYHPARLHLVALFCAGAIYYHGGSIAACLKSIRPSRPIAYSRSSEALAFSSIELAKIFGRLTDPSPIGSVLTTSRYKLTPTDIGGAPKWRNLFKHEGEELGRAVFVKRLIKMPFVWPTYYVANRQPPFLVPEKQRHKFKLKGYLGHVATQSHKLEEPSDGSEPGDKTQRAVARQPLVDEAVDSIFKALSHEEEKLTVNHMIAFIKYRSPLLQMVNWEGFIASLPVGPEDIPV